jgi:hypothetical protein
MSLIKKIDVDKHFAARRAKRLGRTGPLSRASARIAPGTTAKNASAPVKDGAMGHSSQRESVTPVSIGPDSDGFRVPTLPRNRQT